MWKNFRQTKNHVVSKNCSSKANKLFFLYAKFFLATHQSTDLAKFFIPPHNYYHSAVIIKTYPAVPLVAKYASQSASHRIVFISVWMRELGWTHIAQGTNQQYVCVISANSWTGSDELLFLSPVHAMPARKRGRNFGYYTTFLSSCALSH